MSLGFPQLRQQLVNVLATASSTLALTKASPLAVAPPQMPRFRIAGDLSYGGGGRKNGVQFTRKDPSEPRKGIDRSKTAPCYEIMLFSRVADFCLINIY